MWVSRSSESQVDANCYTLFTYLLYSVSREVRTGSRRCEDIDRWTRAEAVDTGHSPYSADQHTTHTSRDTADTVAQSICPRPRLTEALAPAAPHSRRLMTSKAPHRLHFPSSENYPVTTWTWSNRPADNFEHTRLENNTYSIDTLQPSQVIIIIIIIIIFLPSVHMIPSGFKKLLEKYENRYEKLIGAVISR